MTTPFRNFADPSTLRLLPRPLLRRLLEGHAPACRAGGLDLDRFDDDDSTDAALWRFLSGPGVPGDLLDAICKIDDLADEAGQALLAGEPLLAAEDRVPYGADPAALAIQAFLEHRDAFLRVHGRRITDRIRNFREYAGRRPERAALPSAAAVAALERRLGEDFRSRGRSGHCRVRTFQDRRLLGFVVSHGRLFRRDEALEEDGASIREALLRWRPQQHDLVVYDNRLCRLRLHAPDAPTVRLYAAAFGETLFGDPGWFQAGTVVSLGPLAELGRSALDPTDGIVSADLASLTVRVPDEASGTTDAAVVLTGRDVFALLEAGLRLDLGEGEPVRARLRVRYASGGRARVVELVPPNQVVYDRRRDEEATLGFLEARGFLAGPPQAE